MKGAHPRRIYRYQKLQSLNAACRCLPVTTHAPPSTALMSPQLLLFSAGGNRCPETWSRDDRAFFSRTGRGLSRHPGSAPLSPSIINTGRHRPGRIRILLHVRKWAYIQVPHKLVPEGFVAPQQFPQHRLVRITGMCGHILASCTGVCTSPSLYAAHLGQKCLQTVPGSPGGRAHRHKYRYPWDSGSKPAARHHRCGPARSPGQNVHACPAASRGSHGMLADVPHVHTASW